MAALNFPSSPTLNQIYTANGNSWKWDGTTWVSILERTYVTRIADNGSTYTGTLTIDASIADQYEATGLTGAITFAVPTGSPINGQKLMIKIKDNGTARALTWTTTAGGFRVVGSTLPTTTVISKTVYIGCIYNSADNFWDVVAVAQQA